ncbi:glycoside hydrolase family 18 protein [Aulographum hederae CBS 113979]|uniref:chitinase n=1 Tax=Aulographum hederae CBS 113979 TaxID=1176131 RepID=A0A6G1HHD3_9PEZI|nr:glycoside hydrolase family 18 protein [Aulographum hederae CBS 113979]
MAQSLPGGVSLFGFQPFDSPALLAGEGNHHVTPWNLTSRFVTGCDAQNPCSNGECCSSSGVCGFGPVHCNFGCLSNCRATAECGEFAGEPGKRCSEGACCSQDGLCGTSTKHCGTGCQSNCATPKRPQASPGDVHDRIVGYWEAWNMGNNQCGQMDPTQIPVEGLTHLVLAYAYINPEDLRIAPMPGLDDSLFHQIPELKSRNPDLKVFISIGGWSFTNEGAETRTVLSRICESGISMRNFANSVNLFLSHYGFDGVDIDWEFPGAPDRGGSNEDFTYFPNLLAAIRSTTAFRKLGYGLSITIPSHAWYLRWYKLDNIVLYTDFINMMSYDLHSAWERPNPGVAEVYGHTNLTEIDSAISILLQHGANASMINLGIAFYSRTFQLRDFNCKTPGCAFVGPGGKGICTNTPGILSFREMMDVVTLSEERDIYRFYDEEAAINYMVYHHDFWISYDNPQSFQAKIDFANGRGLGGLHIWSIDMDTDDLHALKTITGRDDLRKPPGMSSTLENFNVNDCRVTDCGGSCSAGEQLMVKTNLGPGGGCPNGHKDSRQRSYCCPQYGAPDPSTCQWYGSGGQCYGQCHDNEILMLEDDFGGASHCDSPLKKVWCCPATRGDQAVRNCVARPQGQCTGEKPQSLTTFGNYNDKHELCCPDKPKFNNCAWYGSGISCSGNRCPAGQVQLMRHEYGDGWGCSMSRQKAFCCDPPVEGSAFVPVPLTRLFPDRYLQDIEDAVYAESFDEDNRFQHPSPPSLIAHDPNQESFAWIVLASETVEDLVSFDKRDGSHLELFDCPDVHPDDHSPQRARAVCIHDALGNCEEILQGGATGTIIRLPEHCTDSSYVRAVNFSLSSNQTLASHLVKLKRAVPDYRVYDLEFDYDFKNLRRDGGEIYFRVDASNHPGYWDAVVAPPRDMSRKRGEERAEERGLRSRDNWREFDRRWLEETHPEKWAGKFDTVLHDGGEQNGGLEMKTALRQALYSARHVCEGMEDAHLEVKARASYSSKVDYGMSFMGALKNFEFSEAYGYIRELVPEFWFDASIEGRAKFDFQSPFVTLYGESVLPLAGFNIKGIIELSPYHSIEAQLGATGVYSGSTHISAKLAAEGNIDHYIPPSLDPLPRGGPYHRFADVPRPSLHAKVTADYDGSVVLTLRPTFGYGVSLTYRGTHLAETTIESSMRVDTILQTFKDDPDCDGARTRITLDYSAQLEIVNPIRPWASSRDGNIYPLYHGISTPFVGECLQWGADASGESTEENFTVSSVEKRANENLVFDFNQLFIACPTDKDSEDGDCR